MQICERLKEARKNSNMTQEEVAERILVSRVTVSNWENGKTLPDIANLISLSDLYDISLDELIKGDSKMIEKINVDTKALRLLTKYKVYELIVAIVVSLTYVVEYFVNDRCKTQIYIPAIVLSYELGQMVSLAINRLIIKRTGRF